MEQSPPCQQCTAACCKQNGHNYAVALYEEETSYNAEKIIENGEIIKIIPYKNGKCIYLQDNKCSIYENRPKRCKEFNCTHGYPNRISFFLEDNQEVLELLQLTIKNK